MHWVQALIAPRDSLDEVKKRFPVAVLCSLPQGLTLLPITDMLAAALIDSDFAASDPASPLADGIAAGLASLAARLSARGPVIYAATFIHGGTGRQDALVWIKGELVLRLGDSEDEPAKWPDSPISRALRHIGVKASAGEDEFDAIGLGRHRSNDAWAKAHEQA